MAKKDTKQKLYRIGQVAKLTGLQAFVLRFWEKEFELRLPKAKSGHRFYRQQDIQKILTIKRLLYTEGYTIKGAIQKLKWGEAEIEKMDGPKKILTPREAGYRKSLQAVRAHVIGLLEDIRS